MAKLKFEHKITLAYLLIGGLWIVFSDTFLNSIIKDADFLTELQTYKGWFYVIVTGLLFYIFIKRHLRKLRATEYELERHKNNLQELIDEKTRNLDKTLKELHSTNEELNKKNDIINNQNSELKTALENLKETESQLLQSEKMASLGILTNGIAHEINNPLNYILGGYTGLEQYFQKNNIVDAKVDLLMHHIKTGIDRSAAIVSELGQFSSNIDNYDELCDIHKIIENCLLMLNNIVENKIEIIKQFSGEQFQVIGNVAKLHQAILNILLNSTQAIEKNGSITITTKKTGSYLNIHISDTGIGISKENLPKVTDPFYTTKGPGKGTGLGLSTTFSIIKEHKGELKFESELNKGTTVKIKLPLKYE